MNTWGDLSAVSTYLVAVVRDLTPSTAQISTCILFTMIAFCLKVRELLADNHIIGLKKLIERIREYLGKVKT